MRKIFWLTYRARDVAWLLFWLWFWGTAFVGAAILAGWL